MHATKGTANVIRSVGLECTDVSRLSSNEEIFRLMDEGKIDYIVYTGKTDVESISNYISLHHHAILLGITVLTSLDGNKRKPFYAVACFNRQLLARKSIVKQIFCNSPKRVRRHTSVASVTVEYPHFRVRHVRFFNHNNSVRAYCEMSVGEVNGNRFGAGDFPVHIIEENIVVVDEIDIEAWGQSLIEAEALPHGACVECVRVVNSLTVKMRDTLPHTARKG